MGIAASVILMVLSIQESCRTVVKVKCMFFILFSLRRCKMYFIASTYIAHWVMSVTCSGCNWMQWMFWEVNWVDTFKMCVYLSGGFSYLCQRLSTNALRTIVHYEIFVFHGHASSYCTIDLRGMCHAFNFPYSTFFDYVNKLHHVWNKAQALTTLLHGFWSVRQRSKDRWEERQRKY